MTRIGPELRALGGDRRIMVDVDRTATIEPGELGFPDGMVGRSDGTLVVAETFPPDWHCSTSDPTAPEPGRADRARPRPHPGRDVLDAEDGIWFASVLTREVVRVDTAGNAERLSLDQNAYACMLGGEDRRTLYVATAPDHEPAKRRAAKEGRIDAIRVEVPGAGGDGIGA